MQAKGIRILDKKNGLVSVELPSIFSEIKNGDSLYWSILYSYATGDLGQGQSIPEYEQKIADFEKGSFISWGELNLLSKKLYDVMDFTLIGCYDQTFLKRYENECEMHDSCDIVIEMIDSSYWEVYSKNEKLIEKLAAKFKQVEFLD